MLSPSKEQAKADREQAVAVYEGNLSPQLRWTDDERLYLGVPGVDLLKMKTKWRDVDLLVDLDAFGASEKAK